METLKMRTNKQLLLDVESLSETVGNQKEKIKEINNLNQALYKRMTFLSAVSATILIGGVITHCHMVGNMEDDINFKTRTIGNLKDEAIQTNVQLNKLLATWSMLSVTKETLRKDLELNYPELSKKVKDKIVEAIMEESSRYNINPLLLYALCHVESSFRPWLEHELVAINVNGKTIRARAVGLTGVMWEHHKEELRNAGIAESRGDLFDTATNIKAGAFIYNEYYKMDMIKGAESKDESALLRYFGGNYPVYVSRIESKVLQVSRQNLYRRD
jgi:hypothetical protein